MTPMPYTESDPVLSGVDFATARQRVAFEVVYGWLYELYGESAQRHRQRPSFLCSTLGTQIVAEVEVVDEYELAIYLWSYPLGEVVQEFTERGLLSMLELNAALVYGSLTVRGGGVIVLEYATGWEGMTKERIGQLVLWMATATQDLARRLPETVAS